MARSWEYARWRQLARQTVLLAGFGITVALAWWVGHVRAAGLRVDLGPPQTFGNKVLPLEVRLPPSPDWTLNAELSDDVARLDASEQKSRFDTHRSLSLVLQRLHPSGNVLLTPEQIIVQEMDNRPGGHTQDFTFLGYPGVLMQYPVEFGDKSGKHSLAAVLYACTVIPNPKPTAINVYMVSPVDFTPTDIDLLKRFAQSLSVANPAHHAPMIPTADLKPRPQRVERQNTDDSPDNNDGN